jgi:biopolymer transport protein ExbD/biopolymer transport protein TolR
MAEINITPFTDVLLVLLIIFMILAAIIAPPGFQKRYERAPAHAQTPVHPLHQFEIDVTRANRIYVDGRLSSAATLYALVAYAVRAHTDKHGGKPHIALVADKDSNYDGIIKILDAARQAHDEDVGLVTY